MARKNEGWFDLLVTSPWWVSVIVSSFVYFMGMSVIPNMTADNIVIQSFLKVSPTITPFLAFFLLIPAPISAFIAWRKRKLLDDQKSIQTIRDLSWREFEELVAEAYRRQGYIVIENTTAGADGGIDIRLKKDNHTHLVQCKNWKTSKVGVKVVREMYGVLIAEHASSVIIIVSGVFTQEAKNFALGKAIDLVDGGQLEQLIANVKTTSTMVKPEPIISSNTDANKNITCPKCGEKLLLRTAKKGKNAGGQFWGCSTYPRCRYTQDV